MKLWKISISKRLFINTFISIFLLCGAELDQAKAAPAPPLDCGDPYGEGKECGEAFSGNGSCRSSCGNFCMSAAGVCLWNGDEIDACLAGATSGCRDNLTWNDGPKKSYP